MNDDQFVTRVRAEFDAPWLEPATREVARQMDSDGGHDFGHLYRVFRNALGIAEVEGPCDLEAVVAAVIFHDVVNLPKNHPERHTASSRSAEVAVSFYDAHGFGAPRLELVAEAIRCHSWSAKLAPESLEAKIVADADNLEAVGAFGVARTFYVAGRMGSAIVDMADPAADQRALDDTKFAVDHFHTKLLHLREHMHTSTGRRLAEQRHAFMLAFLDQLQIEL